MSNNPAEKHNKKKANKTKQYEQDMNNAANYTDEIVEENEVCEPKVEAQVDNSFSVKVDIDYLNIRKGPGMDCERTGDYTGKGVFVISEVKDGNGSTAGWGRLKSGEGWISLDYATRV
jgi:hypothetical protein